jgi:hypothetical protein
MRKIDWLAMAIAFLGLAALVALPAWADEKKADKPGSGKVGELIKKLGSDSFDEREAATKALDAIGEPALEALKKAAKSDDAETQKRAEELVKNISKRVESARILAPTKVQLKFKDTPVKDALAELSKQSKYQVVAHDPNNKLGDRKVTLETGELSFWEAFDKLCKAADLTEANPEDLVGQQPVPVPVPPNPGPLPPQRIPQNFQVGGGQVFQVQVQPAQPAPPQQVPVPVPVPVPARPVRPPVAPVQMYPPDAIVVVDGKPVDHPTFYSGALRFRGLPADPNLFGNPQADEQMFILEVTPEPKLQWQGMANLQIEKAIDDLDQKLAQYVQQNDGNPLQDRPAIGIARPVPNRRIQPQWGYSSLRQIIPARLKKGVKEAKLLKEVSGVASVEVRTPPEPMITVENVLKSAGNTVKGDNGGNIKVIEASKDNDTGIVKIRVQLDYPPEIMPAGQNGGGGVMINPGGPIRRFPGGGPIPVPPIAPQPPQQQVQQFQVQVQVQGQAQAVPALRVQRIAGADGLALIDEKGNTLVPTQMQVGIQGGPGGFVQDITMEFKLEKDAPAPAKLVFTGTRLATLDVPFKLKDVPLKK